MSRIGTFKATPTGFIGSINSLRLHVRKVEFRAVDGDPTKDQPAYRIFAEDAEIGAAWKYTSGKGVEYLSVSMDDPSFPAPVSARLFPSETGFDLVWSRPGRRDEPAAPEPETRG